MLNPLSMRAMSGFPISIATGLALETLFSPTEESLAEGDRPERLTDYSKYNLYAINVSTLIRNILGSVSSKELLNISKRDLMKVLEEEINLIRIMFEEQGLRVSFYVNSYEYYWRGYEKQMRVPSKPRQFAEEALYRYAEKTIRGMDSKIEKFSHLLEYPKDSEILLISHYPCDLLTESKVTKLDLLESHTGKIKSKKDFWTKYYKSPGLDLSHLPFFEFLLLKFGDTPMFIQAPLEERKALLTSLRNMRVTPFTREADLILRL